MRYFTDEQLKEMKQKIKDNYGENNGIMYSVYLQRIEELNEQCVNDIDKRKELIQLISEMQSFFENNK